jgi:lipid A 3-O-deacylase
MAGHRYIAAVQKTTPTKMHSTHKRLRSLTSALLCAAAALSLPATADWRPNSAFVQGGVGPDGVSAITAGATWPFDWSNTLWGGQFTAYTELSVAHWRARSFGGGHQSLTQLSLVPMLRYRFDEGRSPWFAEFGIGATVTDRLYNTPCKAFSTRWNFSDNFAVGRSLGAGQRHELSLRLQHISNGDIKKPNPGEEFLQLRYAMRF